MKRTGKDAREPVLDELTQEHDATARLLEGTAEVKSPRAGTARPRIVVLQVDTLLRDAARGRPGGLRVEARWHDSSAQALHGLGKRKAAAESDRVRRQDVRGQNSRHGGSDVFWRPHELKLSDRHRRSQACHPEKTGQTHLNLA